MKKLFLIMVLSFIQKAGFSQFTYSFTGNGNWSVAANWSNNTIPPALLPAGSTIQISPSQGDSCVLDTLQIISEGANIIVPAGVHFIVSSNLVIGNNTLNDFPNTVGDSWLYLVSDTAGSDVATYYLTVSVVQNIQFSSGINANMWVYTCPAYNDTNYVYNSGDSIIALSRYYPYQNWEGLTPIMKRYIIPSRLYSSWEYQQDFEWPCTVTINQQTAITTPQNYFPGTFHLAGYLNHHDESDYVEEWIKNGVGIVKKYYENIDSHGVGVPFHKTSWLLTAYHVQ